MKKENTGLGSVNSNDSDMKNLMDEHVELTGGQLTLSDNKIEEKDQNNILSELTSWISGWFGSNDKEKAHNDSHTSTKSTLDESHPSQNKTNISNQDLGYLDENLSDLQIFIDRETAEKLEKDTTFQEAQKKGRVSLVSLGDQEGYIIEPGNNFYSILSQWIEGVANQRKSDFYHYVIERGFLGELRSLQSKTTILYSNQSNSVQSVTLPTVQLDSSGFACYDFITDDFLKSLYNRELSDIEPEALQKFLSYILRKPTNILFGFKDIKWEIQEGIKEKIIDPLLEKQVIQEERSQGKEYFMPDKKYDNFLHSHQVQFNDKRIADQRHGKFEVGSVNSLYSSPIHKGK